MVRLAHLTIISNSSLFFLFQIWAHIWELINMEQDPPKNKTAPPRKVCSGYLIYLLCLKTFKFLFSSNTDGMGCCSWNLLQKHLSAVYQNLKSKRKHITFKYCSTFNCSNFLLQSKCMFVLCREMAEDNDAAQARDLLKRFNVCPLSFIFCFIYYWANRISSCYTPLFSVCLFNFLFPYCRKAPKGQSKELGEKASSNFHKLVILHN